MNLKLLTIVTLYIVVLLYILSYACLVKFNIITLLLIFIVSILAFILNIYLNKKKNMPIHKKFIILGVFFGIILIFAIPVLHGIDEGAHFYKVYSFFNKNEDVYDENNKLIDKVPQVIYDADSGYDYFKTHTIINGKIKPEEYVLTDKYVGAKLYSIISYIPYLLPMFVCYKLLNLDIIFVIYIGRIFAFVSWLLISAYTIKIIPKRKEFFVFLCLMPIMLTLVTTYTGDLVTNVVILLFLAYWYRLYSEKRLITKKEIVIITILGIISACAKLVYAMIFLILFLLPIENFKNKKHKIKVLGCIISIIILSTLVNLAIVGNDLIDAYPAINLQKEYILSNFGNYIKVLVTTIINGFFTYMCQFTTGQTTMCQNSIMISDIISMIYIFLLGISILLDKSDVNLKRSGKILISAISIAIVIIIFTSLYLQWTATHFGVGAQTIYGVQGRYFFPLVALCIIINTKKAYKIDSDYLWTGVILINIIVICRIITVFL